MRIIKMNLKYNIIFDLDGTLVHTAPALAKAANNLLKELNLPEISTSVYSTFIGGGIKKQVQRLLAHFEYSYSSLDKYVKRFMARYSARLVNNYSGGNAAWTGPLAWSYFDCKISLCFRYLNSTG